MKVAIKWSKTLQTRDRIHNIILPKLHPSPLCSISALRKYNPAQRDPLFQVMTCTGFKMVTESRLRKTLSALNVKMGFPPSHFTFHTFRHSGATCAYNFHVPIQAIKTHGSWASNCIWTYIQEDTSHSADIARSFVQAVNAHYH